MSTINDNNSMLKRATGIAGLDDACAGGLPAGGLVLLVGGEASGKTVLCLNILACAAQRDETSLMLSFEESESQIRRCASSFAWGDAFNNSGRVSMIDARLPEDAATSGSFGLDGLQATLAHALNQHDTRWVVLDGIDRLARLHDDPAELTCQLIRLHDWCDANRVTVLLTGKHDGGASPTHARHLEDAEFALSTVIVLSAELVQRRLNRRLRIAKYRGSGHVTDELAMLVDHAGITLPLARHETHTAPPASNERLSTGIPRLDAVLGGGIYRHSTLLISGSPGTSKTTLAASISAAAVARGERALFISFDELADRIVRNVASVGIDLSKGLEQGLLRIESCASRPFLLEEHFIRIQQMLDSHAPDLLVIDPTSALLKANSAEPSHAIIERLVGMIVARGITLVITSLLDDGTPGEENTLTHFSTIADTWITLSYHAQGGERNRTLSVIKSRGTGHSNQVRELLLSSEGVELANVFEYGSEVLTGTARLLMEQEVAAQDREHEREQRLRLGRLQRRLEELDRERAELAEEYGILRETETHDSKTLDRRRKAILRHRDPGQATTRGNGGRHTK